LGLEALLRPVVFIEDMVVVGNTLPEKGFDRNLLRSLRGLAARRSRLSDVDLLVDVGSAPTPWFPGGLVAELEALLGRRVQVITERGLDGLLRDRVLQEAVPL
jgi:predicted nucleotidyltransferase